MRARLNGLLRFLHRIEDGVLVLLLAGMIGIAVAQIVLRNGFDSGFLWADTMLRILVLWIGLTGALVASRDQRHISIDVLGRFLPRPLARGVSVFNALFTAGISAALAWYTFEFVQMEYESPSLAFANVPTWACESIIPLTFALIALRYICVAILAPWRDPVAASGEAL